MRQAPHSDVHGAPSCRLQQARRNLQAHHRPYAYQQISDLQIPVESSYRLSDDGTVGITVGDYDSALPLIIDPTFRSADTALLRPCGVRSSCSPLGVQANDVLVAQIALE